MNIVTIIDSSNAKIGSLELSAKCINNIKNNSVFVVEKIQIDDEIFLRIISADEATTNG